MFFEEDWIRGSVRAGSKARSGAVHLPLTFARIARRLLREPFGFMKFPLGLKPELFIPSGRSAVLFPDLSRAPSDSILRGFRQDAGTPLKLFGKRGYALCGFPIAYPASEAAVLFCLGEKAADELLAIHAS